MKTAKQWVEESNWSEELKALFWERVEGPYEKEVFRSLEEAVGYAFIFGETSERADFWREVAKGKRTDIDRPAPTHAEIVEEVDEAIAKVRDEEYEALVRKLLQGLKGKEVGIGIFNDAFTRGYNTGIREMKEKIDEAIEILEL